LLLSPRHATHLGVAGELDCYVLLQSDFLSES
jgi:hypothetical protein